MEDLREAPGGPEISSTSVCVRLGGIGGGAAGVLAELPAFPKFLVENMRLSFFIDPPLDDCAGRSVLSEAGRGGRDSEPLKRLVSLAIAFFD
jgi:hypothetical protein